MNKNTLIESGAYEEFKKVKNNLFFTRKDTSDLKNYPFEPKETKAMMRIYENHKKRNQRMYERVVTWLFAKEKIPSYKDYCIIFATLTFEDSQLANTTPETRRRYVSRFLNQVSEHYIANVDFGEQGGREHYHALLFVRQKLNPTEWEKGFSFYEEVRLKENDYIRAVKYLNKITNHSFKASNKLDKVIYDRNNDYMTKFERLLTPKELREFKILLKRNYL